MAVNEGMPLFGGSLKWNAEDWTDSDDRVRGGSSQVCLPIITVLRKPILRGMFNSKSYLLVSQDCSVAHFNGTIDTQTLGGAGFASQRTTSESKTWDLSNHDGIELSVLSGDDKKYTFILKDELLPTNADNGREQSTISYEFSFRVPESESTSEHLIKIPWTEFKATYRGKEQPDADPLKSKQIKRFSIMARSYFDKQDGEFSLQMKAITAYNDSQSSTSTTQAGCNL